MGDLEDLDLREAEARGDAGLGIGREKDVGRAVGGEQDDRVEVRVLARRPRVGRPERTQDEPARPVRRTRPDDAHRNVVGACRAERLLAFRSGRGEVGVEHLPHVEPAQNVCRSSHVVALRMREHERPRAT